MEENKLKINDNDVDEILESKGYDIAGGEIFHYKEKPFTGIIESFYENGNLRDAYEYTDGSIGGYEREYYENGQIKSEDFKFFNKYKGIAKEWNENGDLISEYDWDSKKYIYKK